MKLQRSLAVVLAVCAALPSFGASPVAAVTEGEDQDLLVAASPEEAEASGLTVLEEVGFGWTLVETSDAGTDVSPQEAAELVAEETGFEVEPDQTLGLADEPLFPEQWGLENTGQGGGKIDADVDVLGAWEFTSGSPSVVVAVLDTGVTLSHPDLVSRIWVNSGEIGGNGIDDDGNGWIDDVRGWDAVEGGADPTDTHGHGTFVASIATAAVNGLGMAGVAPDVALMPGRVCTGGGCSVSQIVTGISYAITNGADVINLSFGGNITPSSAMEAAIRAAVDAGIVVVAAAGNDARNNDQLPFYPAGYDIDGLVAVAATDRNDALAAFSNYGPGTVDLAAPGANLTGALLTGDWSTGSGTSFSAPMVSGTAALIETMRPDLDPVAIVEIITGTVDVLPSLSGRVATGGRLNAGSALERATSPVAVVTVSPSNGVLPVTVRLDGSGSFDPWGSIVSRSWVLPDGSTASGSVVDWTPRRPGTNQATLTLVDDSGLTSTTTASFTIRLRPGGSFVDDNGHFAERAIEAVKAEGITVGCNPPASDRFCPNQPVTRAQMAAFLARALRLPASDDDRFDDDDGSVFEGAIDRLATAGITVGCNPPVNDRFCPDRSVSRAELAVFLVRAFHLEPGTGSRGFVDVGGIYQNAIDRLRAAGVTQGCNPPVNDRFCPDAPVTRAEMAVFLARVLHLEPIVPPPLA